MAVQALSTFDPQQFLNLRQLLDPALSRLDTQVNGVALSNDLSSHLTVTTAEGDRITLSTDFEADLQAVNYRSLVRADGAAVNVDAKGVAYSLKQEFGVTVEGDLNGQEVHDLNSLFTKISDIIRQFVRGQDDGALNKTVQLADRFDKLSSLSSLDLSIEVERSVTLFASEVATEATGPLPSNQLLSGSTTSSPTTPGGAPTAVAAIPQPSTGTTAPTPPSASPTDTAVGKNLRQTAATKEDQVASLIQQVFDAIRDIDLQREKLEKHLPFLLDRVRQSLYDHPEHKAEADPHDAPDVTPPSNSAAAFAYRSFSQTSFNVSLHS